jgi:polyphosphate glucokinase
MAVARNPITLAIDIGGSGVKTVKLDPAGKPQGEFLRLPTPRPATPLAVLRVVDQLVVRQGSFDRVSLGFPGVIKRGVVGTAVNLHPRWVGLNLEKELARRYRRPSRVANDADVQGMGAINGRGVEMVITLGTGIGSALFVDGVLMPNLELGHHPFRRARTYEEMLGRAALDSVGKKRWNRRLAAALEIWKRVFNYDRLYLGGGNTKRITLKLPDDVKIAPNREGLLGGVQLW